MGLGCLSVLAARQHGADARTRSDVDTEENTFWTWTRFQVPAERATIDDADILKHQAAAEFSCV